MTHTLTHTGKRADGNNGVKSAADLILLEQKEPESVENQGPEGSQPVGKDEVGGSNPPSSSKEKSCSFNDYKAFSFRFWNCFPLNFPFSVFGRAFSAPNPQAPADFREGKNDNAVVFEKAKFVSAGEFQRCKSDSAV